MAGRNTFRILNMVGDPLHAGMIAWLLDPKGEHGIGDRLLAQLVDFLRQHQVYWPGPGKILGETLSEVRSGKRVQEILLTAQGDTELRVIVGGHEPGASEALAERRAEGKLAVGMAVIPGAFNARLAGESPIWSGLDLLQTLREVVGKDDPYTQTVAQYTELLEDLVGHRRGERPSGVYELSEIVNSSDPGSASHALLGVAFGNFDDEPEGDEAFPNEPEMNLEQEMLPSDDMSRVYMVRKLLGRGGHGYVFDVGIEGEQEFEGFLRPVTEAVLKIARPGHEPQLLREAEVYQVSNRGMVKLLDTGTANDAPYLVLEKLHPHPGARFGTRQVDVATAIDVFVNLLEVLRGIHADRKRPLLLLDIKPDNLMLRMSNAEGEIHDEEYLTRISTGAYEPVFMDMGIARDRREVDRAGGKLDKLEGTPAYLPPEAYPSLNTDSLGVVSEAVDVYALTLSFYEMLTGARAYEHRGVYELKGQELLFELVDFKFERVDPVDTRRIHRSMVDGVHEVREILRAGLHPDPDLRATAQRLFDMCKAAFKVVERRTKDLEGYRFDAVKGLRVWQTRFPRIKPERNLYTR
ncbi:MAG: PD-(D/E)XK nuclease family protein [Planctomycetota bacterium]